jgi:phenylacetate-coenzyme A ligase PaaK-like adenylate-forming protein
MNEKLNTNESLMRENVYWRLLIATQWISSSLPSRSINSSSYATYLHQQIPFLESLSYYLYHFTSQLYYRYDSLSVFLDASTPADTPSRLEWVFIQISLSILCGNQTIIRIPSHLISTFQQTLDQQTSSLYRNFIQVTDEILAFPDHTHYVSYSYDSPILVSSHGLIQLESLYPELKQLLKKRTQPQNFISDLYLRPSHCSQWIPSDEFDYLSKAQRDQFVRQRTTYLHFLVSQSSPFYREKLRTKAPIPYLNGVELSTHLPPHGDDLISHVEDQSYDISFATGGTSGLGSGAMKYVYRLTWEDEENARYLAKGLHSQGLTSSDIVMNCLSSGFWGGMHVFNLALKYLGCSVIPLGPNFTNSETIHFIRDLKPTFLLAIPSYLLKLAEHLETLAAAQGEGERESGAVAVTGVITGGEMLYEGMKKKMKSYLGVTSFLSTGYTSNETGAIGFRCQHLPWNHFHLHENMQTVSILSSEHETQECAGSIICTNLNRTYLPILEYSIGDSGCLILPQESTQEPSPCPCGRQLSVLELRGRCDDRIRLGGEDIYSSQIAKILEGLYGVTMNFSIVLRKAEISSRDVLELLVERSEGLSNLQILTHYGGDCGEGEREIKDEVIENLLGKEFRKELRRETRLHWYDEEQGHQEICGEGIMEQPLLTLLSPHELPRNARTGKIRRIEDRR